MNLDRNNKHELVAEDVAIVDTSVIGRGATTTAEDATTAENATTVKSVVGAGGGSNEDATRAEIGVAGGGAEDTTAEDKGQLYPLLLKSLLTGVLVALVVSLFRWGIPQVMGLVSRLLAWARGNALYSLLFVGIFVLIGLLVSFCTKKEPMIGGSGIPQVSGILQDKLNLSWWKIFINKLLGGLLAIGSGLSLGREGPSVQIGGALGQGVGELSHSSKADTKMLLAGGAGAGMAVAFNAPISGLFFTVEELFHQTSHRKFMSLALTVLTATSLSRLLIGSAACMKVSPLHRFEPQVIPQLLGLGLVIGLSGVFFNKAIMWGKDFYDWLKVPVTCKHVLPFVVTAIFLLLDPSLLGSGENFILTQTEASLGIGQALLIYTLKLFLLLVAFSSGIPGGIFFPLLALGSLIGQAYASALIAGGLLSADWLLTFALLAMAGHFAAIVRAPLTGIFLILEMTGGAPSDLLPLIIVSYAAYFTSALCRSTPVYEALLNRMLTK